jgi:GAF domain-containing protein
VIAREEALVHTFVALADTLVDEFDVIDFLHGLAEHCVEILDVSAAGIMLADSEGRLRHAACSSEQMRLVELFELQLEEGPCFDAYKDAGPVQSGNPEEIEERWPHFAAHAFEGGFLAVAAVPMRLRSQVIGALNLFSSSAERLGDDDVRVAQAMADIATIGILQERAIRDARALSVQLERALESRVVIEQARGAIAERSQINVDAAFELIRDYSRSHNRLLSETARAIVNGGLRPEQLRARTTGE